MTDERLPPCSFPAVERKKVTAAFDGGRLTSDGGVMLLTEAERRLGLADKLAAVIGDHRDPARVIHTLPDILRARILAIASGWEDADEVGIDYVFGLPGHDARGRHRPTTARRPQPQARRQPGRINGCAIYAAVPWLPPRQAAVNRTG